MLPLVVEVVVLEGGDDGNGEETESNCADCEHDYAILDVSGTGVNMIMRFWMSVVLVILYKEKQPHKQGIATKI